MYSVSLHKFEYKYNFDISKQPSVFWHAHDSNYQISPMTKLCERIFDDSNESVDVSDREELFRQILVPLKPFDDVTRTPEFP